MLKKYCLPIAVRIVSFPIFSRIPKKIEDIGAALQSKRGGGFDCEWQEITNARHFIRRSNPLIFDIGANHGNWATRMLNSGKTRQCIIMFEPQPSCWPVLKKLTNDDVRLETFAASDHCGSLTFYQTGNTEIAGAYPRSDFNNSLEKSEVPCSTIDKYMEQNEIEFVDFIKMDIEGHELSALKGALKSLEQKKIGAFSFEFGQANVNSRTFFIDYFNFCSEVGYSLYRVAHDGIPIAVSNYSRSLEYFGGVANYIASISPPRRYRK